MLFSQKRNKRAITIRIVRTYKHYWSQFV